MATAGAQRLGSVASYFRSYTTGCRGSTPAAVMLLDGKSPGPRSRLPPASSSTGRPRNLHQKTTSLAVSRFLGIFTAKRCCTRHRQQPVAPAAAMPCRG